MARYWTRGRNSATTTLAMGAWTWATIPHSTEPARQGKAYKPDRQAIIEDAKRAMAQHGWGE